MELGSLFNAWRNEMRLPQLCQSLAILTFHKVHLLGRLSTMGSRLVRYRELRCEMEAIIGLSGLELRWRIAVITFVFRSDVT